MNCMDICSYDVVDMNEIDLQFGSFYLQMDEQC